LSFPFQETAEQLFGEGQNRIVISLKKEKLEAAKQIADAHGTPLQVIGATGGDHIKGTTFSIAVEDAHSAYMNSLSSLLS